VADARGSSGFCEVVAGLDIVSVGFTECGFNVVKLVSLNGPCVSPVPESLYLSNQSDITQCLENSVNKALGFVGWVEDLEVVVVKDPRVMKGWVWLGCCIKVALVDWLLAFHGTFDVGVSTSKVVSDPATGVSVAAFFI
jgi:hypothetical protein